MPVGFSSPARNLFLLGSSGAQVVSNFFESINKASTTDGAFVPDEIRYIADNKKYALAGSAQGSNSKVFGWLERQDYNLETGALTTDYSNRIESTQSGVDTTLRAMELDVNNNLIVVGRAGDIPWIAKYSNAGVLDWQSTTNTANLEYTGITFDSSGNYYACGSTPISGINFPSSQAFVEKFDSNNNPGWGKQAFMLGRDVILEKISANDRGEVVAVGYLEDDSADKGYIVKIDTTSGEVLWDRTLERNISGTGFGFGSTDGIAPAHVRCTACYIDSQDQIYVVGTIDGNSPNDNGVGEFLIKYTAEGNMVWQRERDTRDFTASDGAPNMVPFDVKSDGETEQTVVLSVYDQGPFALDNSDIFISKYSKSGDLVFRRRISKGGDNLGAACLDADPSFYYIMFRDQQIDGLGVKPDRYTFGKVSTSGNGLGAFQYDDGTATLIDYTVSSDLENEIGRLSDGSVRNDSSDLITYPFTANKLVFDDLATHVSNKKRQMDSADSFEYSGSPAIRVADFQELNLLGDVGVSDGPEVVQNGTFDTDVNNWTAETSTISWNSGRLETNRTGGSGYTSYQAIPTEIGKTYTVKANIDSTGTGGRQDIRVLSDLSTNGGSILSTPPNNGVNGSTVDVEVYFTAVGTTSYVYTVSDGGGTGFFDNISVKIESWLDQSGKGNDGVVYGATHNAAGYWEFDGVDDSIQTDPISFDVKQKTLECWVKLNSITQQGGGAIGICTEDGGIFDTIVYNETNSGWGFGSNGFARTSWSGVLETSTADWTHIVATYDDNDYRLFRNGVQIYKNSSYGALTYTAGTVTAGEIIIGRRHGLQATPVGPLDASIGEARFYPRVLTPAQVFQNYNATKSKYIDEGPVTAPKISPDAIVYDSNLLLNYDFGNRATYDSNLYDRPFVGPAGVNGSLVKINGTTNDQFGTAVDIGGGKLVVGESSYDSPQFNSGRIHVMDLDGSNAFTIEPTGLNSQAYLGASVFVYNNNIFSSTAQDELYRFNLDGTGETIISSPTGRSLKGSIIDKTSGKIAYQEDPFTYDRWYIADFDGTNITNEVTLTPPSDAQRPDIYNTTMGYGKIALQDTRWSEVGGSVADNNDDDGSNYEGRVYVYDQDGTNEIILRAPDVDAYREVYTDWDNSHYYGGFGRHYTQFGSSVAFGPDRIVVGCDLDFDLDKANIDTGDYWYAGAAYIFDHSGNFIKKITGSTVVGNAYFGSRVNVYDNKIFVGAAYHNNDGSGLSGPGAVFVFDLDGNELGIIPAPAGIGNYDLFGGYEQSIAYDSNTGKVAITADRDDGNQGSVNVFDLKHSLPTTVKNLSSSSNTATITSGKFDVDGYFEDDASNFLISGPIDTPLSGGTMEAWIWFDNVNQNQGMVQIGPGAVGPYINFYSPGATSQKMRWEVIADTGNSYTTILSNTNLTTGQWYHFVGTFDGGLTTTLYVNGTLDVQQTNMSNQPTTLADTAIQIGNYAGVLDGRIGEVRFYTRDLSATEVSQNFNATRGKYGV